MMMQKCLSQSQSWVRIIVIFKFELLQQYIDQINIAQIQMLSKSTQEQLNRLGLQAEKTSDMVSGVKLAKLINNIFYGGHNQTFESKIIKDNEQRKGNNVININIILKQIKNDQNIHCPQQIRNLTSFAMIEDEAEMTKFIDWIVEQSYNNSKGTSSHFPAKNKNDGRQKQKTYKVSTQNEGNDNVAELTHNFQMENEADPYEEEHDTIDKAFQNVFYCDRDIEPENIADIDSLDGSAEKVVKKDSYKVIRPKTSFQYKIERQENQKKREQGLDDGFVEPKFTVSEEYIPKMLSKEVQNDIEHHFEDGEPEPRKTVPKIAQRPPIYKKSKTQTIKAQKQQSITPASFFKTPAPFSSSSAAISSEGSSRNNSLQNTRFRNQSQSLKKINQQLFKGVEDLDKQIKNQKREIKEMKSSTKRSSSSNRKMFKLEIPDVGESDKKLIVQWLISINLLNSMAGQYYDKLHEICKNGVIFPQIINHQKGRGAELGYFKKPRRSAEVHSNYQKVFNYLKDVPTFNSELLFHYEYFVPEAQQSSFWGLLNSCKAAFQKKSTQNSKIYTRDSLIKERITEKSEANLLSVRKISSERKNIANNLQSNEPQYQRIRYGSNQKQVKREISKSNPKYPPQKVYNISNEKNNNLQNPKSKRKSSLDFIKELPEKTYRHEELIQVEEPKEEDQDRMRNNTGYRNLHEMKKNHTNKSFNNLNTPKKKTSDLSASRSRIISTNSIKKKQQICPLPSISLEMQMKGLKYLKEKGLFNPMVHGLETLTLFEDPIRNGTLFNIIIKDECQITYKFTERPRNIEDCRSNFRIGFTQLKTAFSMIPIPYEQHFQEIIRGEMSLFYGIIWHLAYGGQKNKIILAASNPLKNQSAILNLSQHGANFQPNIEEDTQKLIYWIRTLEQDSSQIASLQIRDLNSLHYSIVSRNLFYKIATVMVPEKYTLKPTYQNPINSIEQESNLKKILSFFTHNKILKSENAWKARSLVMKDNKTTINVMRELMSYNTKMKEKYNNGGGIVNLGRGQSNGVTFMKYARKNNNSSLDLDRKKQQRYNDRLETTMANHSFGPDTQQLFPEKKSKNPESTKFALDIPWMNKLGYSGDLSLNSGVILCRLVSQMTMQTIYFSENPTSKAEGLTNIRKAIKHIQKFKWDEHEVSNADEKTNKEIYKFLKEKYRNSYAMKMAV